MASLPSNTFLCNYNAKNYNPSTHTIPNEQGAIFAQDMVLNAAAASYTESSITIDGQSYYKVFNSTSENPFNRSGTDGLTIVAKLKQGLDTSGAHSIVSNRDRYNPYNWMLFNPVNNSPVGVVFIHDATPSAKYTQMAYIEMTDITIPNIFHLRYNNGLCEGYNYTNSTQYRTTGYTWGSATNTIQFFQGYGYGEKWRGEFCWIYISPEALTDAEIQKVIDFNEGGGLSIEPDSASFSYSGGSSAVTITSDSNWSASTENDWITLSPSSGTSAVTSTTVTVSENKNYSARTGRVTFTDGENSVDLSVNQEKTQKKVFLKNLYREDEPIRMLFRNGSIIYREFYKLVFDVDVSAVTFDYTGGTQAINITSNENWNMTLPEWLIASSVSGKSSATVSLTASENTGTTQLTGTITITCGGKTKEISVKQNENVHYVSFVHFSGSPTWNSNYYLNTGIYAADDCEIRVVYQGKGANVDRIAGFLPADGVSDNQDFRIFYYTNGSLDVWSSRQSNLFLSAGGLVVNNVNYDITFGNFFCYNNLTESYVFQGTSTSMNHNCTIRVDVGGIWLNRLQIKNGGVVVFDGKAAVIDGVVGLYDSVSGTMVTNTNIGLSYEE